jgi:hypothetical protein
VVPTSKPKAVEVSLKFPSGMLKSNNMFRTRRTQHNGSGSCVRIEYIAGDLAVAEPAGGDVAGEVLAVGREYVAGNCSVCIGLGARVHEDEPCVRIFHPTPELFLLKDEIVFFIFSHTRIFVAC